MDHRLQKGGEKILYFPSREGGKSTQNGPLTKRGEGTREREHVFLWCPDETLF